MPLTNFKSDLTSYLKKLAGVHAVGDLWWHYDPKSKPAGVQLFSGQLLSRKAYIDHWTLVSTKRTMVTEEEWQVMVAEQGFCQFYSSGDGSTTYRMPMVKGVHPKFVASLAEAGQYIEAGLPNITGRTYNANASGTNTYSEGALSNPYTGNDGYPSNNASANKSRFIVFDASKSNPIYGTSDTVQPPAVNIVLGEYVVGTVAVVGEADAESLLASVTTLESGVGRASAYVVETWDDGAGNWYRKYSDGWIEQGGITTGNASTAGAVISLPMEFANTDYFLSVNPVSEFPATNAASIWAKYGDKTTTTFKCSTGYTGASNTAWQSYPVMWQAKGF